MASKYYYSLVGLRGFQMTLIFLIKHAYGRVRFYPQSDSAYAICRIAERKCLEQNQIDILVSVGFLVVTTEQSEEKCAS